MPRQRPGWAPSCPSRVRAHTGSKRAPGRRLESEGVSAKHLLRGPSAPSIPVGKARIEAAPGTVAWGQANVRWFHRKQQYLFPILVVFSVDRTCPVLPHRHGTFGLYAALGKCHRSSCCCHSPRRGDAPRQPRHPPTAATAAAKPEEADPRFRVLLPLRIRAHVSADHQRVLSTAASRSREAGCHQRGRSVDGGRWTLPLTPPPPVPVLRVSIAAACR